MRNYVEFGGKKNCNLLPIFQEFSKKFIQIEDPTLFVFERLVTGLHSSGWGFLYEILTDFSPFISLSLPGLIHSWFI